MVEGLVGWKKWKKDMERWKGLRLISKVEAVTSKEGSRGPKSPPWRSGGAVVDIGIGWWDLFLGAH